MILRSRKVQSNLFAQLYVLKKEQYRTGNCQFWNKDLIIYPQAPSSLR